MVSSPPPPLILASGSRYRCEMLKRLELPFEVHPADIDERPKDGEGAEALALRLALEKAQAVHRRHPGTVVIGSDQVAVCQGRLLGKPGSVERAVEQLRFTAGREVVFHSALALKSDSLERLVDVPTRVRMRTLDAERIRHYVAHERPLDCAGAMKSEGLGIALTRSIHSDDPTALIGLPLIALAELLPEFGIEVLKAR
ncbi:Maf family protein [Wenzhouxiangella marina]|uniref:7-methyl-GTP pyrophosphatase n=1 Tax=Wenzhouxiangella marina TaxID=1579979 RepID=A0A0K0XW85_9GAMM|nr:Maf family nucleotide pyrophosphatase [Wenzhouxiangella marina]AKS41935.1 septum formation inhibitor Maf [Wenzhouxiangella marina]MBB6086298.1 septum formation protein [Wenzhouxiangella marina]